MVQQSWQAGTKMSCLRQRIFAEGIGIFAERELLSLSAIKNMINIPSSIFLVSFILISFGIIFRIFKLKTAVMLMGLFIAAAVLMSFAAGNSSGIMTWIIWGLLVLIGINIMRFILGSLFGQSAADSVTGSLLYDLFTPVFRSIGGFLRKVLRIK